MGAGHLFIMAGPSGAGKNTLVCAVRERKPHLGYAVSATTRAPRPGEQAGVHYHFLDDAAFSRRVDAGDFVEWAHYGGARYGTLWSEVRAPLQEGRQLLLDLDVVGARAARARLVGQVTVVLVIPPSWAELCRRLRARGSESAAQQHIRLRTAVSELSAQDVYDYVVVNDEVARAVDDVMAIMTATACRFASRVAMVAQVADDARAAMEAEGAHAAAAPSAAVLPRERVG